MLLVMVIPSAWLLVGISVSLCSRYLRIGRSSSLFDRVVRKSARKGDFVASNKQSSQTMKSDCIEKNDKHYLSYEIIALLTRKEKDEGDKKVQATMS